MTVMVMNHTHAKVRDKRSLGSNVKSGKDRQTHGWRWLHYLPC